MEKKARLADRFRAEKKEVMGNGLNQLWQQLLLRTTEKKLLIAMMNAKTYQEKLAASDLRESLDVRIPDENDLNRFDGRDGHDDRGALENDVRWD